MFEDYKVKVSNKPAGFEEYEKLQTGLEEVSRLVSSTDYEDFVKEFESKKGKFIEHMSAALTTVDPSKVPMISSLIDMMQIEDAHLSFSQFLKKYTSRPDTNDKKFTESPYFKLGNTGLSTPFEALRLKTTTHFRTSVVTPGLEEKDVFKVLRANKASYPDIEDKHIDQTEEIYALGYLNKKWKDLALRVFDGNYENVIKDLIGATIVPTNLETVLLSLSQPDLFIKPQLTHAQNVKKLDTDLKPALLHAQATKWTGKEKERRDIIDVYTTYSGIIKYGNKLNSQNPKIEDFHDK